MEIFKFSLKCCEITSDRETKKNSLADGFFLQESFGIRSFCLVVFSTACTKVSVLGVFFEISQKIKNTKKCCEISSDRENK